MCVRSDRRFHDRRSDTRWAHRHELRLALDLLLERSDRHRGPRWRILHRSVCASDLIGFSTIAGPTLGGLIVTNFDWRWIFFVNVPIGIVALVGAFLIVPDVRPGRAHRFDVVGVVLSGLALLAIVYALIEGQRYEWGTITGFVSIPLLLVVGFVLLA